MPAKARNSALRAEDTVIFPVEELSSTAAMDEHYSSLYLFRKKMGRKRMRVKTWIAVVAVLALAACTAEQREDVRAYCDRNPAVCILAGAVVIGGVVGAVAASESDSPHRRIVIISDGRLKADIHPVGTLHEGIKLYAYRYRGDDEVFVGPVAQDLLADPRFRHAVSVDAKGYYRIDLTALHLDVINGAAMKAAGERAESLMTSSH